tara:strand:+ start:1722 stop:2213 length:492 start_codon:yes stop_codon:yes gene_type:complete
MNIKIKKNGFLTYKNFKYKCSLGCKGLKIKKKEGDEITPKGKYTLGKLYYRKDRIKNIFTKLEKKIITKNSGWCHDVSSVYYNKEIKITSNLKHEKLHRKDHKYDILIVINYNTNPIIAGKGSAIFLHLTKNYSKTKGCVAITKRDLVELIKYINKKTKIFIG